MQPKRFALFSAFTLAILLVSLVSPAIALADEATPPPAEPSTEVAPVDDDKPADPAPAPVGDEGAPEETDTAPTEEADPTEAVPTEAAPDEPAPEVEEVLDSLPEETVIVALDAEGEALPLASVEAAQVIVSGDPMWCPAGVLPGGAGCTASFNSFTGASGLLNTLAGGAYSGNGVIYVAQDYDSSLESGDVALDGSLFTSLQNLTIQGGWDGVLGSANIVGRSLFDGLLVQITGWNYNVSVNDIEVTGSAQFGLGVETSGNITANNIYVHDNDSSGAILQTSSGTGNVTLTNSTASDNGADGLDIAAGGNITLNNVTANANDGIGASLFTCGCITGDVSVSNSDFIGNQDTGLEIDTAGNVTLNGVSANNNIAGIDILAGGNVNLSNISTFENDDAGIIIDNSWNGGSVGLDSIESGYNGDVGIGITSDGNVSVNETLTGLNGSLGLGIETLGNVTLANTYFFGNFDPGAAVLSYGSINVSNSFFGDCYLIFCGDQEFGAIFQALGPIDISNSQFNNNSSVGLLAMSLDGITLNNVTADNNGGNGAVLNTLGNINVTGGSFSNNFDCGCSPFTGIGLLIMGADNVFLTDVIANGNSLFGADVVADGDVSLKNVTANANGLAGAVVNTLGNVKVCGGSYSYNGRFGFTATAGTVFMSKQTIITGNPDLPIDLGPGTTLLTYNCEPKKPGDYKLVTVSDGQSVEIDCEEGLAGIELHLPNGDSLIVPCPMRGPASLSGLAFDQLPAGLPDGFTFVSALEAQAARDGLTVSFIMPSPDVEYTILRWNGASWVELDGATTVDGMFAVVPVTPGIYVLAIE